tara:strand:+ start:51 stop:734 length:684 start_codon:yes stop_codon:yes gene_type:complete
MSKNIKKLKNKYQGEDIWLLLAGSSVDYIDKSFFENKITIGQNHMFKLFPCNYIVMKDCMEEPRFPRAIKQCNELNIPLLYSEYYGGKLSDQKNIVEHDNSYVFSHNPRKPSIWLKDELPNLKEDDIITSRSTVTTLMHIACYMGAKNIILCGHDCGTINGNLYAEGYTESDWKSANNWNGINTFLNKSQNDSILVRDYLKEKYNVNIYSINPFLNLGLENNEFKPC